MGSQDRSIDREACEGANVFLVKWQRKHSSNHDQVYHHRWHVSMKDTKIGLGKCKRG